MKAVKTQLQESNPDRVAAFEKGAQDLAKKIVANFKDYEFYIGESMNPDGMVCLLVSDLHNGHIEMLIPFQRTTERTVSPLTSPCGRTVLSRLVSRSSRKVFYMLTHFLQIKI